ncbi:hypothetical protein [Neptunicella sp. SCSIO 80796]|uniref:hypothetical protein n=1 Tax=Neptunicella plasticusilytica TaxID=3117012 RepID=UPI003A4D8B06
MFFNKVILQTGLFVLLSSLFSVAASANQHNHKAEIRLATLGPGVGNFAPVLYVENHKVMGSMPDQIRCAFAALQIDTQFIPVPIGRHIWAVDKHRVDGYFPATAYEENTSPLQTSIVLLESEIAVYSLSPVDIYSQPAPLVATVRRAMAPEKFIERHQLPVVKTSGFNQAIELLLKKRVEAVIANTQGFELAAKNEDYQYAWHKQSLESVQMRLFLSPNYTAENPDIFSRLNPLLEKCKP